MDTDTAQAHRFDGTVAVFYNPITQVDTREWDSIREFDGPFHPLLTDYRCDESAVVRQQLQWMRRAGIDAIVYDVYGFKTWEIPDLPKDRTLPLLLALLAEQADEARPLQLILWLEKWFTNPTPAQYRFGLDYVRARLAAQPFYYRYHGKPLVLAYLNGDDAAISALEPEYPEFTIRRVQAFATPHWSYVEDYPQTANRAWMPVQPGFDPYLEAAYTDKYVRGQAIDAEAVRRHGPAAAARREDGAFFARQLLRAREVDPEIIFLSGWNDWQCCLQLEPAVEYGCTYLDLTARLLGREAETAGYRRDEK